MEGLKIEENHRTHKRDTYLYENGVKRKTQEIYVYLTNSGEVYRTTADSNEKEREEVINAFNLLY